MKNEKGFSLIEVIIAIALTGIIAIAVCYALATASKVLFIADERATAESLARQQMEYIKGQPYSDGQWSYQVTYSSRTVLDLGAPYWWDEHNPLLLSELSEPPAKDYAGYSVKARADPIDADRDGEVEVPGDDEGIRRIMVEIYHPEDDEEPLVTLEAYKGDR